MNLNAQALGRLGRGKPKNFTAAEIARRRARMRAFNQRRRERAGEGTANLTQPLTQRPRNDATGAMPA